VSDDLPSRVVCSICLGASLRAEKADPDWLGRQIGRHADRANAALERAQKAEEEAAGLRALLADRAVFERAQKAEEEAAGLRARLSHYDQIGEFADPEHARRVRPEAPPAARPSAPCPVRCAEPSRARRSAAGA
jgi:hypothetical protein